MINLESYETRRSNIFKRLALTLASCTESANYFPLKRVILINNNNKKIGIDIQCRTKQPVSTYGTPQKKKKIKSELPHIHGILNNNTIHCPFIDHYYVGISHSPHS